MPAAGDASMASTKGKLQALKALARADRFC
jgi:hypothetical protein